ncbi:MAG: DUF3105 domain-containing protein [Nocardioides sp.]
MAKPKDKDRRAVVEQMRREQQRSEKRRTRLIIAACAFVALAIIAVPAWQVFQQEQAAAGDLATLGVPADEAGCQEVETKSAEGMNDHRTEGEVIAYPEAPPAFGPHYPQPAGFGRKFYTAEDRPSPSYLVHNLEHGYNILWYDETIADNADDLAAVKAIAKKFEGDKFSDKFIAAPWTEEDGKAFPDGTHVALTHWSMGDDPEGKKQVGVWKYCAAPSGEVVSDFVKDYPYTDSPEPGAM